MTETAAGSEQLTSQRQKHVFNDSDGSESGTGQERGGKVPIAIPLSRTAREDARQKDVSQHQASQRAVAHDFGNLNGESQGSVNHIQNPPARSSDSATATMLHVEKPADEGLMDIDMKEANAMLNSGRNLQGSVGLGSKKPHSTY